MTAFPRFLSVGIVSLCLFACEEKSSDPEQRLPPEPMDGSQFESDLEQLRSTEERINKLQREVESSVQVIEDLNAAVLMERAKLEDDPDYDQTFLKETLDDQEREKLKIEQALKQIETLSREIKNAHPPSE